MMGFISRELKAHTELSSQAINDHAFGISERVGGNVNLAQLRIDDLLNMENLADAKTLNDRLPRSIVAFFDSEIDQLLQRNPIDRDLGLMAIAAVAQSQDSRGMKAYDLERVLRKEKNTSPHLKDHTTRSLEDILVATNGLLALQPYEDVTYVACFNNRMFVSYVREDYNESLYLAKSKLCWNEEFVHQQKHAWDIAPKTTSPPTISDAFDAEDYIDARSSSQDSAYYSRTTSLNTAQKSYPRTFDVPEPKGLFERGSTFPVNSNVSQALYDTPHGNHSRMSQGLGGDFESEGQLMHKVYRFSHCNIAIADSENSEGGLFRTRTPATILPATIEADGTGKLETGSWRILRDDLWNKDLLGAKIYTRGWVFQERMLAPRIIHFAASQIFWDCSTLSACEALPTGLPYALDAKASTDRHWRGRMQLTSSISSSEHQLPLVGSNDDSIENFWRLAVLNYTSCNLTSQGDKSIAIWSIAKLVRDTLKEEYGGGLWQNELEEQLAWHTRDLAPENEGRIAELQHQYPSWSWASVKGAVIAHGRLPKARHYVVTNHEGDPIAFESSFSDENEEPKLNRVPMPILGYVGQALVLSKAGTDIARLHLNGVGMQDSSGTFHVFLDEALPGCQTDELPLYPFIILAASATSTDGSRPGVSSRPSNQSSTSVSSPEVKQPSNPVTYSGIGLLLTPLQTYQKRQDTTFKALLREVAKRSPDKSWPDPPYGQGKSLVDRTTDMRKLVGTLRVAMRFEKEKGGEGLYRRVGAIEFRDVEQKVWDKIAEGQKRIWLD
ncbi:hypothetical protein N0V90_005196 [Kalmusia sp. IMI 367209]|nr:hypothetical protein N0V90_005196 [Kalmusia sp. IMI 367209]